MTLTCFSQSYAEAREKFLSLCAARGLAVEFHVHPLPGRDGEQLAVDVARHGPADAANLLVISSGCHGVEGFCGSGVQLDLLGDDDWMARSSGADLAVLYIHAMNPYGFSWLRRVTQENVDLNRNFVDFEQPLPDNPDYRAVASQLLPRRCPPTLGSSLGLVGYALRHGRAALQAAISRGQHSDPRGLFFAGDAPTWSNRTLRTILQRHGRQCRRLGWIDLHTGLGPRGVGERIYKGRQREQDMQRSRQWWGPELTNSFDGSSTSAHLNGTLDMAVMAECAQAEYTGLTLEYGTLPGWKVLGALRAEQWLQNHPETDVATAARIKRQMRDAFYVDADDWKRQVLEQGREVAQQTLDGLRGKPRFSA
ncbi:M14 family metallopeptidase [Pseudomonas tohonis]|uniref:M14 family metallopeptidase n=1 Tax=Pseudomonas tohonis TaxID=2725477 RepID=UPI0021D8F897|nr:M14 family metallopeptidase [Pseudomonas tohonis]UXY52970.1 M14 family metallopeptidase [Pseudomonas tohonis]